MRRQLACADFTFPLLAHDRVLDLIALLELDGVDVGLFEERSHLWPSREFASVGDSARRLKNKLDDRGLKLADVFLQLAEDFTPYAINRPEAERRRHARDRFEQTLAYAVAAGAAHVTTLPGVYFDDEDAQASWDRAVAELIWRVERSAAAGITFAIEAHVGSIAESPATALQLVTEVPGLTLTLDYTHFTRLGMADAEVEPLIAEATHFHVRGARKGRLQTAFKDNAIDYERVIELMNQTGYSGWLGIEYIWMDWEQCNECDNVSETILFRDFLRRQG